MMSAIKNKLLLSGIMILLCIFSINAQVNSVSNSGFEDGSDVSWSYNFINGSDVMVQGTATDVFAGDSSLQLNIQAIGSGGPQVIGVFQDLSGLVSGGKYLVSCAVKGPAGQKFRFRILGDVKQYMNFTLGTGGWSSYEFLIDQLEPSSDGEYRLAVEFAFDDNTPGNWLIDDFKIEDFFTIPGNLVKVYVSPHGDDTNSGSLQSPVKTVAKAFEKLAGDTIYLMEGTYHEESILNGKSGTEGNPIVITPLPGHEVVFDGTIPLDASWELHTGNIYKTNIGTTIWQLFKGDTLLMPARWPNAFLHDGTVWDRELYWAHGKESASSNGTAVDDPSGANDLAASGIDATGAMAIMNVGSWKTSAREVLSHSVGSNTFNYDPVPFTYKTKHHYYYLEGTLELLDAPGEWCYDTVTGDIYVWAYDGQKPVSSLRGKNQSYALTFSNCDHIEIKGIDFFATTLKFSSCTNAVIEDCNFSYPSSSKRALLSNAGPDVLQMKSSTANLSHNKIINCSIRNTESHAFYLEGNTNLVENCRLENIDWVVADRPKLMNSIYLIGDNNIFRRNTVSQCGASSTIYPGNYPVVELNRVWSTGHLQSDGSITQVTIGGQTGSVIQYNWFHNTVKSGARFDAPIPPTVWGNGGTMRHNVIWATGSGLMLKGEYNFCFNNTVYGTNNNGIIVLDGSDGGGGNVGTIIRNNISDKISGHRSNWTTLPGVADHNWNGYTEEESFESQLFDPGNLDFRPDPDKGLVDAGDFVDGHTIRYIGDNPDIGAYEFGDSIYWIAGRKLEHASTPVPPVGRTTSSSYVDLMWLEAYKAKAHDVYFGGDSLLVADASTDSESVYLGRFMNNMVSPGMLTNGEKYFWRVDVFQEDGSLSKGNTWYFTAGIDANIPFDSVSIEIFGREAGRIGPLDSAEISINGNTVYTDSTGLLKLGLSRGQYDWSVEKTDYETKSSSFYSEEGLLIRDTLDRISARVSFMVDAAGNPLESAEVTLGTEVLITDHEGSAVFYPVLIQNDLQYTVSLLGYETLSGSLNLSLDTILNLSLEPVGIEGGNEFGSIRLYPNPASDILYIKQIPPSASKLKIYRIDGAIIIEEEIHSQEFSLSLGNFGSGEYILYLSNNDGVSLYQKSFIVNKHGK
jgi:hypothetical protein